jgi:hypothetical protein
MRRILILSASFIAAQPAAMAADANIDALRIMDAVYGDVASRHLCDATPNLTAICEGLNPCKFQVSNALCGDPAPNVPKRFFLAFKCGILPTQTLVAPEMATVAISCPKDSVPGKAT